MKQGQSENNQPQNQAGPAAEASGDEYAEPEDDLGKFQLGTKQKSDHDSQANQTESNMYLAVKPVIPLNQKSDSHGSDQERDELGGLVCKGIVRRDRPPGLTAHGSEPEDKSTGNGDWKKKSQDIGVQKSEPGPQEKPETAAGHDPGCDPCLYLFLAPSQQDNGKNDQRPHNDRQPETDAAHLEIGEALKESKQLTQSRPCLAVDLFSTSQPDIGVMGGHEMLALDFQVICLPVGKFQEAQADTSGISD